MLPLSMWVLCCAAGLPIAGQMAAAHPGTPASGSPSRAMSASTSAAANTYAREPAVVERLDTLYRFNTDGTSSRVETAAVRVQNDAGVRSYAVLAFPYLPDSMRVEVMYARVVKPKGATIASLAADAQTQTAPLTQVAPQFSNVQYLLLPVKGLAAGDHLEYQVRIVTTQARIPGQFWGQESFGHGRVILERSIELHVPADKHVQIRGLELHPQQSHEKDEAVYRWSGSQLHPTVIAKDTAEDEESSPLLPPIAWTTFDTWAEVSAWYRGVLGKGADPTPEIRAKADQVVFGLQTPVARVQAIFTFVSREIRSIDVPLGDGPFAPHTASEVLANQIGDSKDKSVLLLAMLRAEGLTAALALVDRGGEIDPKLPAPFWFNQVLVAYGAPGTDRTWLNVLPEAGSFGLLSADLRGRKALLIPALAGQELVSTPADLPFQGNTRFVSEGTLSSDGALTAHVSVTMHGEDELRYREILQAAGPAQADRTANAYLQAHGLRGDVSGATGEDAGESGKPLRLSFDLSRSSFGDWSNFRITPLEPGLGLPFADRKTSPEREIDFEGVHTETAVSRLDLPKSFSADLPQPVHIHTAFADLDKTYKLVPGPQGQTLEVDRTLAVKAARLPASDWMAYRRFLDDVQESEPPLQLTSAARDPGHQPPAAGSDSPAAAKVLREAQELLQQRDWTGATKKLDEAKRLNDRQPLLWSSYAFLAEATGKQNDAVDQFRHELRLHPEEAAVSRHLAALLASQGRKSEAVDVLRPALDRNPADQVTSLQLANLLAEKDLPAAEKLLRISLASTPDSLSLKLALSRVLFREKTTGEATSLVTAVASAAEDPGLLNDAAYTLAEHNVSLNAAEAAARKAIQLLNLSSLRHENFPDAASAFRFTQRVIASWDTYGFVLLKEGKLSEAELWLHAAWADSFSHTSGVHYAALLQKLGRAAEAGAVLRAAGPAEPVEGAAPEAGDDAVSSGSLVRSGSRRAEVAQRSFRVLRPAPGPAGTAVFYLEYALNMEPAARIVSGDEELAPLADALKKVNTFQALPPGTLAHLLRRGIVRCTSGTACTLELLIPEAALHP